MVGTIVDHAHQKKEHAGDRAVIKHLQHSAIDPLRSEARHAEHHVPHMTDAGVGDELLQIFLCHGAERPVNNIPGAKRA